MSFAERHLMEMGSGKAATGTGTSQGKMPGNTEPPVIGKGSHPTAAGVQAASRNALLKSNKPHLTSRPILPKG